MLDSSFAGGPELVRITKFTNENTLRFWPDGDDPPAAAAPDQTQSDILKKGQARATYSSGAIANYLAGNEQLLKVEAAAEYRALERMHRGLSLRVRLARTVRLLMKCGGGLLMLWHFARWAFGS